MSNYFLHGEKRNTFNRLTSLKLTVRTCEGFGSDEFPFGKALLLGDMPVFRSCKWNCTPYKWPYKSLMLHGWNIYLHLPWDIYDGQSVPQKIHGSLDVPGIRIKGVSISIKAIYKGPITPCEPRKKPLADIPLYWLFNRDPYLMVYYISLYNWIGFHPQTIP